MALSALHTQTNILHFIDEEIVTATHEIAAAAAEKRSLTELFHTQLDRCAKTLHAKAAAFQVPKSETYGSKDSKTQPGFVYYTFAHEELLATGKKMLQIWCKELREMDHDVRRFNTKTKTISETHDGREYSFDIEIVTPKDLEKFKWDTPVPSAEMIKAVGYAPEGFPLEGKYSEQFSFLAKDVQFMRALKEKNPALYKRNRLNQALTQITLSFPSYTTHTLDNGDKFKVQNPPNLKSLFILGTARIELEPKKRYAFTQSLTWLYQDHKTDPLDRMVENSKVLLIHQDPFLIESTLKDIANIFQQALLWDKSTQTTDDLKDRVALLRYEFSHALPFVAGNDETALFFEKTIYSFHHFNVNYADNFQAQFEALTSLRYSDFLRLYRDSTTLTQME